jgi:hypothetical protein
MRDILSSSFHRWLDGRLIFCVRRMVCAGRRLQMKRFFVLALLFCASAAFVNAQVVDTDVCSIVKSPKSFDGKMVRFKGVAVAGFDQFIIKDASPCGFQVDGIWLDYPQGTKGKAGALAVLRIQPAHNFSGTYTAPTRTDVTLDKKNKDFKQFDNLLSQQHSRGAGMCLGCTRYQVNATFVGRLDAVADANLKRDKAGKIIGFGGFGNMNAYPARLVLQAVSDVTSKEVDFSKSDAATKGETATFGGTADLYDPLAAAQKSIAPLAGSPAGEQAQKNVAAFGKSGEHNGVNIINGTTSEASAKDEALGLKDSPDGLLFNVYMNQGRLEGDQGVRALLHMGNHISDLRNQPPSEEQAPMYIEEYNAWMITTATALVSGQKYLTLPGGYLVWDTHWTADNRNAQIEEALKAFLANEAALSR